MYFLLVRTVYLEHRTYFNIAFMGKSVLKEFMSPRTTHGVIQGVTAFGVTSYARNRSVVRSWNCTGK